MDKLVMFCVYDSKVEGYLNPFTAMNRAVANRIFETAVLTEGHDFHQHAEDYTLFEVGQFDPDTGVLEPGQLSSVANAHQVLNKARLRQEDHDRGI